MGLLAVADLRAFLLGDWAIERAIDDRLRGERGRLTGTATFAADRDAISWFERGTLRIGELETAASRRLRIVPHGAGWEVRFDDGRPFHPLDLRAGGCAVDHPCRADHYAGAYEVLGPDAFAARWRVTGPRKDQEIATVYRR